MIENNILYSKQFGFQNTYSTDHAVVQLVDQIVESFENNTYILGVFIDLSKGFVIVDNSVLLEELELYGVMDKNYGWVKSCLLNTGQFFQIDEKESASLETVSCGSRQDSILEPLLFLLYVDDLKKASNILHPIMFADDTNQNIRYLSLTRVQYFSLIFHSFDCLITNRNYLLPVTII